MSTALVTGARGQVGRRIVDRLVQAGWDARGFDLRSGYDVRDPDALLDAAEGCAVIVHAGDDPPAHHPGAPSSPSGSNGEPPTAGSSWSSAFAGLRYGRGDGRAREEVEADARAVGVPESQIDWPE
jgi:NAD(P)-dependent dehydrogenase (short-subunit alcohol dehydrogenase family)